MNCPVCNSIGKILETRTNEDDTKRRRYACTKGHRYSTREIILENTICSEQTVIGNSSKPELSKLWPLSITSRTF